MKIAVIEAGYVGISISVLLSQNHDVMLVDIIKEKVELINNGISPIKDNDISDYLAKKKLKLVATTDFTEAVTDASFVVVATPTNYELIPFSCTLCSL